jgi:LPS sulfotransferase NodH
MTAWDQFGPLYNFPEFSGVPRSYLIATTPRCGSHYLGHLLRETGLLGSPLEYFSRGRIADWQERLGTTSSTELFKQLLRIRTSPTGWFGVKAHWPHFDAIAKTPSLLGIFHFQRFIQIVRRDRIAQAVSLVIAQQTSAWISFQKPQREPTYDAAAIEAAIISIDYQLAEWARFYKANQIIPLVLVYEDLVNDPSAAVTRVLSHCNVIDSVTVEPVPIRPKRQATALNKAWVARFRKGHYSQST